VEGTPILAGRAEGPALVLEQPLSWWGGIDPTSGMVVDRHHPQFGACTTGRIVILPHGRGSSGGSAVIAESIRTGTGPAGLVLQRVDPILVVGVLVAAELYPHQPCPLVSVDYGYRRLTGGLPTSINPDGSIEQQVGLLPVGRVE